MLAPEKTHLLIRGSITIWLPSCFTCLDSAALLVLISQQIIFFGRIQTSETAGQSYIDI